MKLDEDNAPYITVGGNRKYFTTMECGDTYKSGVFKKTIHGEESETEKTFQEYYHGLCEEELASMILLYPKQTLENFKEKLKRSSFPLYMIKGMTDKTVEGVEQIDLTESKYNQLKEEEIKRRAFDSANYEASRYGYTVTTKNIEIESLT